MSKLTVPEVNPEDERVKAVRARQAELDAAAIAARRSSDPHAKARARVGALVCKDPSRAVHSQSYDTDINNMVKGLVPFTQARRPGFYIDETILPASYEEQFNNVLQAQDAFMLLPPDVREKFSNDPAELAAALADPSRQQELRDLGVIAPLPVDNSRGEPNAKPSEKAQPKPPEPPAGSSEGAV